MIVRHAVPSDVKCLWQLKVGQAQCPTGYMPSEPDISFALIRIRVHALPYHTSFQQVRNGASWRYYSREMYRTNVAASICRSVATSWDLFSAPLCSSSAGLYCSAVFIAITSVIQVHCASGINTAAACFACRGRRCNVSPKVLLIPLSYASIFGGTTTLIGTSTNLVISGMQARRYPGTPDANFNFFDITPYGLPYGVWGFVYVLLIGIYLLPKDTGSRPREDLLLAAEVGPKAVQVCAHEGGHWGT
eukprot:GHUV01035400.1.p1 GENE.GHUV01035400.1~~GHUV01035400.1.p1  ORF type:complete len:247 (-),score=37.48 GHUV01035400.1:590-1330(-)